MTHFYIYRYIDKQSKKIMYIGKTSQSTVRERINQHKTDAIGLWANANPHTIEFIELPKEEDMNYIESYLIREHVPPHNVIFADGSKKPPFTIHIDEGLWKDLEEYEKEELDKKEKIQETVVTNILERMKLLEQANTEFVQNVNQLMRDVSEDTKTDVKWLLSHYDGHQDFFVRKDDIKTELSTHTDLEIIHRLLPLLNIKMTSKIAGVIGEAQRISLFDKILMTNTMIKFSLGDNAEQIIKYFS